MRADRPAYRVSSIGSQISSTPVPATGSKSALYRSNSGASTALNPAVGSQPFQMLWKVW